MSRATELSLRYATELKGYGASLPDDFLAAANALEPRLPAEALDRVFTPFFRLDESRTQQTGGTGLGLAIAKHLVQAHGGVIGAESAGEGLGTTIWFTIPTAPPSPFEENGIERSPDRPSFFDFVDVPTAVPTDSGRGAKGRRRRTEIR